MTPREEVNRAVKAVLNTPAAVAAWQLIEYGGITIQIQDGKPVFTDLHLKLK